MSSPLRLDIMTTVKGDPTGYDSAIVKVTAGWYATVNGDRVFLAQLVARKLRALSERFAAQVGERLHHAQWWITGDPGEVSTLGLMHDCPSCRAGVDQALTFLRDNPGGELAVGQMWWIYP